MEVVKYQAIGNIGEIIVNNPPVNATSHAVRAGIMYALGKANADPSVQVVVLRCEGRTFTAGADIREFGKPPQEPHLSVVNKALESSSKPIVCAMHGTVLGGGLELALSCHVRLASQGTRLGLPEVTLGLLPGAGGTQRLPRLIGTKAAAELIVLGEIIDASRAKQLGLLDFVIDGDLYQAALDVGQQVIEQKLSIRRSGDLQADILSQDEVNELQSLINKRARGQLAPKKALESVLATSSSSFDEGQIQERKLFQELVRSEQSKALRHAFFVEREAVKQQGVDPSIKPDFIETVGIVGAGTMGTGIAIAFLRAGIDVVLIDEDTDSLIRSKQIISSTLDGDVSKGRISEEQKQQRLLCLTLSTELYALQETALIIEAVYEDLTVKQQVFRRLSEMAGAKTILASNTSYLDITRIAETLVKPFPVIGLHFFSPAHVMRLVEIIRTDSLNSKTLLTVIETMKRIGKVPVSMRVCDGFVGNRMLTQRTRQAYFLLEEGALPEQVDAVLYGFGFPMGPFQMADLAGLDVSWRNRHSRFESLSAREQRCDILDQLYNLGRYGQKTGKGFYRYVKGRVPEPDAQVEALIVAHSKRVGIQRRKISNEEILQRCLYPMVNEGARLLEEGIVDRPGDIDTVWLHGYGFPRYQGGPMFYGDSVGLQKIADAMQIHYDATGESYWKPADLLLELAHAGKGFYTAD